MISLKLQDKKLAKLYLNSSLESLPFSQVLTSEFGSLLGSRKSTVPLAHLRLQSKKPKELPSFNPAIDEEFMAAVMDDSKYKKKETERDIKRKTKKAEKDALRELRKDTVQIQIQKDKEMQHRHQNFKKSIIRGGNIKDDV